MSRQIQIRRGTADENNAFTGAIGEITMDTTNNTLRVHDGETLGGTTLAKKTDITNISIIPDYSAGISMNATTTEQSYICPSNGIVVIDVTGFNWSYGYIKINDTIMFSVTTNGNSSFVNGNSMFIVGSNDVIKYKTGYVHETVKPSTNKLTFYPFRQS